MRQLRNVLALATVGVLAVGCSTGQDPQQTTPAPEPVTSEPGSPDPRTSTAATGTPATAEERNAGALAAIATAAQAAGGTVHAIDDEDDDNSWEVDVWVDNAGVEVDVSADGSTVLSQRPDDDDDDGAAVADASTSIQEAIEAALREVPGALDDAELERENGTLLWEVTVDTEGDDDVEVYVSATDGSIVRVDR